LALRNTFLFCESGKQVLEPQASLFSSCHALGQFVGSWAVGTMLQM
jgi:hypothetical protein